MLATASGALAQSSPNFKLAPGVVGAGGTSSSASFRLVTDVGGGRGHARSWSASYDLVSGFVGGAFSSQATASIASPAGSFVAVAFPVNTANNTVGGILEELGSYKKESWRFGHWSPADAAYMEPGSSGALDLTSVTQGQGYWLITKGVSWATATGLPAPNQPFNIPLIGRSGTPEGPAWNQLGNPFLYPVAVSGLQVSNGATTVGLTSGGNAFTEQVVKIWNGTAFTDATVIDGRTAFWVKKKVPGTVTVIVPNVASAAGSSEPSLAKPAAALWAFAVTARQDDRVTEPLMVGATALAPGPRNGLNHSLAPGPPGGESLSLHIPKADWGEWSGDYVREFQPVADRMSWDFVAAGTQSPGEVELRFEGFEVPSGTRFRLSDVEAGWTREVVPGGTLSLAATRAPRSYRLEALGPGVESEPITYLADGLRFVYPNPFRNTAGFALSLAREGDVRVEIFDIQGRLVRSLERRGLPAGEHVLAWDGADGTGRGAGSGVYLVRWRTPDKQGTARLVKVN